MNKTFDSIAIDTTNIALNIMTVEELREVIKAAAKKLDERAERHRIAIEEAIADAIEDFDANRDRISREVQELCEKYPIYE